MRFFLFLFILMLIVITAILVPFNPAGLALITLLILAEIFLVGQIVYHLGKRLRQQMRNAVRQSSLPYPVNSSLKKSRYYGNMIMQTARQYPPGPMRDRLNLTLRPVGRWLANLDRLEQGLVQLYSQRNLPRELRQTRLELEKLRRRIAMAGKGELPHLQDLKRSKEQHLAVLEELYRFQTQAELKIQKIASDLGATHAEMLLIIAKGDFNENRFKRLDENLQEHISSMKDVLAAMDELGYSSAAG